MSTSRPLGAEKPATKRPRSHMEGPRGGKASCKKVEENVYGSCIPQEGGAEGGGGGARARPPAPLPGGVPSARAGFFLYIYLSICTYLSLYIYIYNTYIYIHLSLSLSLSLFLFLSRSSFWRGLRRAHVRAMKLQF